MGLQRVSAVGRENAMAQEAKMLAPERRRRIVEMLQSRSPILISEAARELGVSTVTVRGDFDALAAQGMLSRVHGGAVLISDYSFSSRKDRARGHVREKRAIADQAAELVGDHETILVGSGSTTYELVRALAQRPEASGITVVTNDWHVLEQGRREFGSLGLVGTGGTLSGVARGLKRHNAAIKAYAVEPASSAMISGAPAGAHKIQGIGANFIPKNFDRAAADGVIAVADNDAIRASRLLAKHEGLLVGISSGAALHAAIQLARQPENKGKTIVALLPDTGERYLSTVLYAFDEYPV